MIGDQGVKMAGTKGIPSKLSIFGAMGNVPGAAQHLRQDIPDPGFVIDDEDGGGGSSVCAPRRWQGDFAKVFNPGTVRPAFPNGYGVFSPSPAPAEAK